MMINLLLLRESWRLLERKIIKKKNKKKIPRDSEMIALCVALAFSLSETQARPVVRSPAPLTKTSSTFLRDQKMFSAGNGAIEVAACV
jgi:hypothetical protein